MNTKTCGNNLAQAVKELMIQWERTRSNWRDVKSIEFGEKYIDSLPDVATRALSVIEEIDALLKKVRSDCE